MPTADASRARPWLAPAAAGVAGACACVAVALADVSSGPVVCPLRAVTGLWCPGCGLTRATHLVLRGDVVGAFRMNLLFPAFLGLVVWAWLAWAAPAVGSRPIRRPADVPGRWWVAAGAAVALFGLLRNVPLAAFAWMRP